MWRLAPKIGGSVRAGPAYALRGEAAVSEVVGEALLDGGAFAAGGDLTLGLGAADKAAAVLADDDTLAADALPNINVVADAAAGAAATIRGLRHGMTHPRGRGAGERREGEERGEAAGDHAASRRRRGRCGQGGGGSLYE